ncbi:asparagine synthase C-terminal domain-containing protein, partial [Falsiroseomonas sp.]|uniref:asparagine synthase-related protein n=1 Tax=Falsiroseomonas sp. TaxID=2870721 RepID=UPI002722AA5F
TRHFFSYGYTDSDGFDETDAAAQTARQLCPNASHDVLKVRAAPDPDEIGTMLAGQEEPVSTPSVLATFRMYRHMHAKGFRVALTGEGSDELFAGYTRRYLPALARDSLRQGRLGRAARLFSSPSLGSIALAKRLVWDLPRPLLETLLARQAAGVIAPAFRETMRYRLEEEIRLRRDPLTTVLRRDVTRDLLPMIQRYADRNGMAASMEVRSPFLDHRLVALALALPLHRKIGPAGGKLILREAFAGILPDRVTHTPKRLGMGHAEQFNAAALPLAALLDSPPPQAERYIDLARLRDCLKATPNEPMLWRPINLLLFLHGLHRQKRDAMPHG